MIFIALLTCTALVMITSAIITLFYEQAVIRYLKLYLDEHLRTQITVEDIRFRLLKGLPNATFELKHIVIRSGEDFSSSDFDDINADTLLEAGTMNFQFDLISLMSRRYELKQINVSDGTLNILIDNENRNNLTIWKNQEGASSQDQQVNLNSIHLNAMHLNLVNLPGKLRLQTSTERMVLKGSVSRRLIAADIKGDLTVNHLTVNNHLRITETDFQLQLDMESGGGEILLNMGELIYNRNSFTFTGQVKTDQPGNSVHIDFEMPDFRLEDMIPLASDLFAASNLSYDFEGRGMIRCSLDGRFGGKPSFWSFQATFDVKRAEALRRISGGNIANISLTGTASGSVPGRVSFQLQQYVSSLSEGQMSGDFLSGSRQSSVLNLRNNSIVDLNILNELIDISSIKNINGKVATDFTVTWPMGRAASVPFGDFIENRIRGDFAALDVALETEQGTMLQSLSGRFTCRDRLTLDSVSFVMDQNTYLLDGSVSNLAAYFSNQGNLLADLAIVSERLDLGSYLHAATTSDREDRSARPPGLPSRIDLNASIRAKTFSVNQFLADDLYADLALRNDSLLLKRFNIKFIDGSISGDALINEKAYGGFSVTCNATTSFIDIHELFKAFNNFTQQFVVDENVRGRLEGSVKFSAEWDSAFRLLPATIRALADIEIHDGELVSFEPMMKLSRYFDAEELMRVKFSTLKNQIMIGDKMVTIPEMEIHSSAFNITASGNHSFDNVFDYRLRVLLSEMLFTRARNRRSEIEEFYVTKEMNDLPGIPLIIAGTPDNYDIQFDRKRAFDLSGQNDRTLDTDLQDTPSSSEFIIEWDEAKDAGESQDRQDREPSEEEFIFQWDDQENDPGR